MSQSHLYEASVKLTGVQASKLKAVQTAVETVVGFDKQPEWHMDSRAHEDGSVTGWHLLTGVMVLRPGQSETFAHAVARAAWKAHGTFCAVEINVADIEAAPCEEFEFGLENYQAMMEARKS